MAGQGFGSVLLTRLNMKGC